MDKTLEQQVIDALHGDKEQKEEFVRVVNRIINLVYGTKGEKVSLACPSAFGMVDSKDCQEECYMCWCNTYVE